MLDIQFIKENKDLVAEAIKNKKTEPVDLDELLAVYDKRKELRGELDGINQERNEAAKARNIEQGKKLKEQGQSLESELKEVSEKLHSILSKIPNVPSPDTPVGPDESGNQVIRQVGEKRNFAFQPKPHWEIGEDLGIIDSERAAKVSGARFTYLKGDLAMLQYALVDFVIKTLTNREKLQEIAKDFNVDVKVTAFIPIIPPHMVKEEVYEAMGRLNPREDKFHLEADNLFLIGSAEHSMGPMYAEETLEESMLPLRHFAYTPAYRREAGSYGKDTRGIIRMHQFDKMEMESFTVPEHSYKEQEFLVSIQEYIMQSLGIPYQVVAICTGDMGFPNHRQTDIEAWMSGQDAYRETHTSDLIGGFQARRLNTKVKRIDGKTEYVHMNDATAISQRPLIAIMENYQEVDGSIVIPEVLRPYMGKDKIEA
jgi:seryl-tRNA synthetase